MSPAVEFESPPCNLCGSGEFALIYDDCEDTMYGVDGPRSAVARCLGCGLVQTRPRPTREEIDRYYAPAYAGCEREPGSRQRLRWVRTVLGAPHRLRYGPERDLAPPRAGARVLEIGSGTGIGLERLAGLGWETWAIEPSARLAAQIVARGAAPRERVIVARAEHAEPPPESFDLISFPHSLEHLHDPSGVLASAKRWLRSDGRVQVLCPNFESLERRLFGRSWIGLDLPRHLFHFSPETLTRLLEGSGHRVDRIVPQFQGSSFAGSVRQLPVRRRSAFEPSGLVYRASLPLGWLLAGLAGGAYLRVEASRA